MCFFFYVHVGEFRDNFTKQSIDFLFIWLSSIELSNYKGVINKK